MHRRNKCLLTLGRPLATIFSLRPRSHVKLLPRHFSKSILTNPTKYDVTAEREKKSPSTPHFDEFSSTRYEARALAHYIKIRQNAVVEGSRVERAFFLFFVIWFQKSHPCKIGLESFKFDLPFQSFDLTKDF